MAEMSAKIRASGAVVCVARGCRPNSDSVIRPVKSRVSFDLPLDDLSDVVEISVECFARGPFIGEIDGINPEPHIKEKLVGV